ncbi:MAG: asparagine synthase (glutamine-hydrolyzing) [Gemmatimonadetes bacterium]|nr:asparagine synthase (glutamine-hydrolyzing) [Gemmatimonadota bacterium]
MCGIAGAYHFDGSTRPVEPAELARMRDTMVHRGPDGDGLWVSADRRVGLAHRRLAIIDLSQAASQPMANEDGSCLVVYNGEIYNHAALRPELERLGHRFRTDHSDTEVILHAYEQWGIDCVHRFRGMFAFGLWDARTRELWLVRDRIGIKPLYYTVRGGRLLFASEIKALLADASVPRALDEEALYHYLTFLTTPAPATLFAGIRKLPGGCRARVSPDGGVRVERYWDVWDHVRPLDGATEDEVADALLAELRTSVRLRKVSDVPVGVFLSGGIDSSTNAVLFSEDATTPVETFSIGYEQDYPSYANEFVYARQVARLIGSRHHERRLALRDALDVMPELARLQDEPIADPVCVPLYYVSRLAREAGVIVCQVGEGSDELFCGYPEWKRRLLLQRLGELPVPRAAKRLGLSALRALGQGGSRPYEQLRRNIGGEPVFWSGAESLTEAEKRRLLSPAALRHFDGLTSYDAIRPIRERFESGAPETAGWLEWMAYVDLNLRLPELLLMRVDKMSMATSLECRVPFLDHEFVALAMSMPERMKLRNGQLKYILKHAVRKLLPQELIQRRKQGFGVPVHEWLFQELGPSVRAEVRWLARQTDFFEPRAMDVYLNGRPDTRVWTLYNLALWWRNYLD